MLGQEYRLRKTLSTMGTFDRGVISRAVVVAGSRKGKAYNNERVTVNFSFGYVTRCMTTRSVRHVVSRELCDPQ